MSEHDKILEQRIQAFKDTANKAMVGLRYSELSRPKSIGNKHQFGHLTITFNGSKFDCNCPFCGSKKVTWGPRPIDEEEAREVRCFSCFNPCEQDHIKVGKVIFDEG